MGANLTAKQARFVEEYLVDLNGTAAAERAGYGGGKGGAAVASNRLLKNPEVAARVAEAREARAARVERRLSATTLTADRVLEEVAHIAFSDPLECFEEGGKPRALRDMPEALRRAVASVETRETPDGATSTKIRFWDKPKGLELTMRHMGMLKDKMELTGKDGEALSITIDMGAK